MHVINLEVADVLPLCTRWAERWAASPIPSDVWEVYTSPASEAELYICCVDQQGGGGGGGRGVFFSWAV